MAEQSLSPVRRPWFVWVAVGLVVLSACLNTFYLFHSSSFDLSEDESHYWEWSRHLDYGYYSKPPGIAWVIFAAIKIGKALGLAGNGSGAALMPVIRMPAIFFGLLSGLLSLFLARRMFKDDRAALAVTLLSGAVPMFAVGSIIITIDSPMYLFWALTVYCLWRAVEAVTNPSHTARNLWLYAAGVACAGGMLFKPVLIALPLCLLVAAWFDPLVRRTVKTWHALAALIIMLLSQVPVLLWNSHHGWVMLRHIGAQGGLTAGPSDFNGFASLAEYVGGQAAGLGGAMFFLLIAGIAVALRVARRHPAESPSPVTLRPFSFLLAFTLPLWFFYLLLSCWKGTQVNWPAAAYFTGMILLSGVVVRQISSSDPKTRRNWYGWSIATIVWGVILTSCLMNLQRIYPYAVPHLQPLLGTTQYTKSWWYPGKWDPAMKKLRAFQERAQLVDTLKTRLKAQTGQEPLVVTGRYDISSSLSFYMTGQPFVYCLMSSVDRGNQYDIWPGPNQKTPGGKLAFAGRPFLVVGKFDDHAVENLLKPAFQKLEGPDMQAVWFRGILVHEMVVYRGYGFKGFPEIKKGDY